MPMLAARSTASVTMATNQRTLQLNLGSLRSAMSLTLHTHHASRIWHGRAPPRATRHRRPERLHRVMNKMSAAPSRTTLLDWWMLRIEDKLDQTKDHACRRCASRWTRRWPTCRGAVAWART
jgi:hypothetical protein